MTYEGISGDITIATTGDAILTRKLSIFREERFLALIELLRNADVAFANLELPVRRNEGYAKDAPLNLSADPLVLQELKWAGINMVSGANNHVDDWGVEGICATIDYLDQARLVHAGMGRHLDEARMPAYLDTTKGRVALIGVDTTGLAAQAGRQRVDCKGRPGVNVLRHEVTFVVDRQAFAELRRVSSRLGFEKQKEWIRKAAPALVPPETETEFYFMGEMHGVFRGVKYQLGDTFEMHTSPNRSDMDDILRWVSEARRQADWVIVSLHVHDPDPEPPEFVTTFARACIDAGVDVITGGSHRPRAIELYEGKPIFYALGSFAFELETIDQLPDAEYERFGLGYGCTPADFYDAFSQGDTAGFAADHESWEGLCAVSKFKSHALEEVKLYPLYCGYGTPRSQRGRPMLADRDLAESVLSGVRDRSARLGTEIAVKDGVGFITL